MKFKLNGKSINIPTSWDDPSLTFGQYCSILELNEDSVPAMLSIFTGIDVDTIRKAEIVGLENLLIALDGLRTPPNWDGYVSKIGIYKLPGNDNGRFNIQFESLGQFEDMRKIASTVSRETSPIELMKANAKYVALYLQKIRDGVYDYNKAMEMVSDVNDMPAKEVVILGSFFWLKLINLLNGTAKTYPHTLPNRKKSKRGTRNSRKNSGRTAK